LHEVFAGILSLKVDVHQLLVVDVRLAVHSRCGGWSRLKAQGGTGRPPPVPVPRRRTPR
jgi:hypothetical protein